MSQLREDIHGHPVVAAFVLALVTGAWAVAIALRAQVGEEWLFLGLLLTTPVLGVAAALVWLRRDMRAHPRTAALILAALAVSWAYSAVMRLAGADAALGSGIILNMLVDGVAAALVYRGRSRDAAGIRGGVLAAVLLGAVRFAALLLAWTVADWLAAGHYPRAEGDWGLWGYTAEGVGLYAVLAGIPGLFAALAGIVMARGRRPRQEPAPPAITR
jgi:hypothetical protein